MTGNVHPGVWLSAEPLGANEGAFGDTVLKVDHDLADAELAHYEWVEEGKPYREFLIPAEVINARGKAAIESRDRHEPDWVIEPDDDDDF